MEGETNQSTECSSAPVITAEEVLRDFIKFCRPDLNGYGAKLWCERKLKEIGCELESSDLPNHKD